MSDLDNYHVSGTVKDDGLHLYDEEDQDIARLGYGPSVGEILRKIRQYQGENVDNIDRATPIVQEISVCREVMIELKAAFARRELEGGVKAALEHPLYRACATRIDELQGELMLLI